jgi:hypothetical protein
MARAWLAVFADWEHSDDGDDTDESGSTTSTLPQNLSLDDPVTSLPTSRKVRSALRKVGAETIRGVAALDAVTVNKTRGVAVKTRKQVLRLRAAVLERFADELATDTATPTTATTSAAVAAVVTVAATDIGPPPPADIDQLATLLVPPRGRRGPAGSVADTVRELLGMTRAADEADAGSGTAAPEATVDWPTVSATAQRVGITTAAASQSFQNARRHWAASPELMEVGTDLLAILAELGGVAGVSELTAPLLDARGSGNDPADARRAAAAVIRAVIESASPVAALLSVRRSGRRTIVAVDGAAVDTALRAGAAVDADTADDADSSDLAVAVLAPLHRSARRRLAEVDPAAMTELAARLGRRADELVAEAPLVPSGEVVPALRGVAPAAGNSLSDARLVRLAGAASDDATTNAASDLVRRGAAPADALRWSRAALVSAPRLTVAEIEARVAARFPDTLLPPRPELDEALTLADLRVEWSEQHQAFQPTDSAPGGIGPVTGFPTRQGTVMNIGGVTITPAPDVIDSAVAEAIRVEERLDRSLAEGGFLALRVPTDRLAQAQRGLVRFAHTNGQAPQPAASGPPMVNVDLEAIFLRHLRSIADQRGVTWANLEGADDPADANWARLSVLASAAVDATIDEVAQQSHVIAWYPGALVRHGSGAQVAPLDRLRDAVLDRDHPLRTLWLVVLAGTSDALPKVDGTPVPALAASQWMDLGDTWLKNTHRAGGLTA